MAETRSVCCYCGVGCGVVIEHDDGASPACAATREHPANFGKLCSKGSTLHLTARPSRSAFAPRSRSFVRRAGRRCTSAHLGFDARHARHRFARLHRKHGPDSVAFYISGQLLTEDYYVFNKLAKGLIGTNNIDTNSRLCMSSAVVGLQGDAGRRCAARRATRTSITRDVIFIAGSNAAWAHPMLFRRIEAAKARNPALQDRRRRSAPHGNGRRSPTCISRSSPAPTSRSSTACCTSCSGKTGSIAITSPRTQQASRR